MRGKTNASAKGLCLLSISAAIAFAAHLLTKTSGEVWASPAVGFTSTTSMSGRFDEIDMVNKPIVAESREFDRRAKAWLSLEKTAGPSDLYVQSNVWQPGGSTGWHTHPGHSLIIVAAGTVTEYEAADPDCTPHIYKVGMSFVDPHHDHAHNIRNEGDGEARTIAIQLIPAGAARRIDSAAPGNCPF